MDKNSLITKLTVAVYQSKGDLGRNQYLLKRIKHNKDLINSDKLYLERILGLKIPEITDETQSQYQQIPKKDKSVFLNPNLIKCATCNKEIKLDEKSSRYQNFWHHETCYKTISKNMYKREKREFDKVIIKKQILEHRQSPKVKHDPVLILLAALIFIFFIFCSISGNWKF